MNKKGLNADNFYSIVSRDAVHRTAVGELAQGMDYARESLRACGDGGGTPRGSRNG